MVTYARHERMRTGGAMLYKVTPVVPPPEPKVKGPREPGRRGRRKSAVYDADGNEVLITLMCLKCRRVKPLIQFGLRRMADGAIRNQPWCRTCRAVAAVSKEGLSEAPEMGEESEGKPPQPEDEGPAAA